jgi:SRSO17 transposase
LSPQEQVFDAAVREELQRLHSRISPRFRRPEVRDLARRYLVGLLGPVERRTGRQMAEQLGEGRADSVQRLLNKARWDADAVRDDLRDYVLEHLGDPSGVLVLTEIGFPKKGAKSAGVERLRNPTTGRLENRQLGLFLAYASQRGWAFIDRALYLPEEWAGDEARCREAGVPEEVAFATKGEVAQAVLQRAFEVGVPAAWVTASEVYGEGEELQHWLEAQGRSYVLPQTGDRVKGGTGGKGTRARMWPYGPVSHEAATGRLRWVLELQSKARPDARTHYRAYGPEKTSLAELVSVVRKRWMAQEGLERAKDEVGLDQYEVRRWEAWHRHVTLSLLAHAALQVTRSAYGELEVTSDSVSSSV